MAFCTEGTRWLVTGALARCCWLSVFLALLLMLPSSPATSLAFSLADPVPERPESRPAEEFIGVRCGAHHQDRHAKLPIDGSFEGVRGPSEEARVMHRGIPRRPNPRPGQLGAGICITS